MAEKQSIAELARQAGISRQAMWARINHPSSGRKGRPHNPPAANGLGKKLYAYREDRGLTQTELRDILKIQFPALAISVSGISRLEKGMPLRLDVMRDIRAFLGERNG